MGTTYKWVSKTIRGWVGIVAICNKSMVMEYALKFQFKTMTDKFEYEYVITSIQLCKFFE